MRLVTWNINSVRLRMPLVQKLADEIAPDIICLQETKTPDAHFPIEAVKDAGYPHMHFHGMKGYNGVAILSKLPFISTDVYHRAGKEDCRHIEAQFEHFVLHNLYIPAGGDEPDPDINEKFKHKLDFVEEMTSWFSKRHAKHHPVIAVGDFNIAPMEHDVWSHKQLLKVVSHTPPETERLAAMRASLDWVDVGRHFVHADEKLYTWWSYRNLDWKKSNRGRRLDHVWVTPALKPHLKTHQVLRDARDWERPSDHVPVIIDFSF